MLLKLDTIIIGKEEGSHSIQLKVFVINKMYITDPKIIATVLMIIS